MTREAVTRRLVCVRQFGMSWTEAGSLTLDTFHQLLDIDREAHDAQQQQRTKEPARRNGVTRTPIT